MNNLTNLCPLDGRYQEQIKELQLYFSEVALIRYRLMVEVEYFIALGNEKKISEVQPFNDDQQKLLRNLYQKFSTTDAQIIKDIEKNINHDVKAVEYYLKDKISNTDLKNYSEFIHFALTSEDVNNISHALMLKHALDKIIIPYLEKLNDTLQKLAITYRDNSLLSLTHGQPATPTTIGKELAVFQNRLQKQLLILKKIKIEGKLNGATGNYAAAQIAFPGVDWPKFSVSFISAFNLEPNLLTTQIEPNDSLVSIYDCLSRINNIYRDLCQDMWLYVSRGIFKLKKVAGEIGSSTMPHKINPINFENAEGNLGLANALLRHLSEKLPMSRMQRDLSGSTVIRNQGVAIGYCLLAYKNLTKGLERIEADKLICESELDEHWEVLSEAIQTILRKTGYNKPYEKLKELTRGEKIDKQAIKNFIKNLEINEVEKNKLLSLTPKTYIGLSANLVDLI